MKNGRPGTLRERGRGLVARRHDLRVEEARVQAALDRVVGRDGPVGGRHGVAPLVLEAVEPEIAEREEAQLPRDGRRKPRGEALQDVLGQGGREARVDVEVTSRDPRRDAGDHRIVARRRIARAGLAPARRAARRTAAVGVRTPRL